MDKIHRQVISLRLPPDIIDRVDQEAAVLSRPGKTISRTDVIEDAIRRRFGIETSLEEPASTLELPPPEAGQKPYKCPSFGCTMRSSSAAATCPTHGRKVVLASGTVAA